MIHSIDHDDYPQFTDYIEIPLTAEEMAMVKQAAEIRGLGPLLWSRNVVRATAKVLVSPRDSAALREET